MAAPPTATGRAFGKDGNWYYHDARGKALGIAPNPTVSQPFSDNDQGEIQGVDQRLTQPSPTASSAVDPTVSQPLHDGNSAVAPNGISAVRPNGISAVDQRLSSRRSSITQVTSEPFRSHLEPLGKIVGRSDFADTSASSCAALRAALTRESTGVVDAPATHNQEQGQEQEQEQVQPQPQPQPQSIPVVSKPVVKQSMVMPMVGYARPKGVVTKRPPPMPPAAQPKARPAGHQTKGERPLPPNWKCYPGVFVVGRNIDEHGNWLGGRLPRCNRCDGLLPPRENHVCPGYTPQMDGRLQPMTLEQRRAIRTATNLTAGDWDDDQYDRTTPADIPLVVKYGEDWDDDHYDATTHGEIDLEYQSEYEDSGTVSEDWDEDRWMAWKRQQLGYSKDYDPTLECQGEELDWEHEEYEDEDE